MKISELVLGGLFVASSIGCAAGASSSPPASAAPGVERPAQPPTGTESVAEPPKEKGPGADVLYEAHVAVPAVAPSCVEGGALPSPAKCQAPRQKLATALGLESVERDTALKALEHCEAFAPGLLRALRAELAEAVCGDALVVGAVGEQAQEAKIPSDVRETLVALGLGARLRRLAVDPPEAPQSRKKEELQAYFVEALFPWIEMQAQAIFSMASQGTHLSGYARGVVAIEAGNADMRFVEIVRNAPIADEFSKHQEARDVYYATLDEKLGPRKTRGRNAALVGLLEMSKIGVRQSERVSAARELLSRAYGGRRVNALDALFLPDVLPVQAESDAAAIASRVPSAYAPLLVGRAPVTANLVRAYLQMGVTVGLSRQVLDEGDPLSRLLLARALFESGRTYFRASDFQSAHAVLSGLLDSNEAAKVLDDTQKKEARLLRALSVALVAGPKDAAEMIAKGPRFADSLGNLALLDGLGATPAELGGRALFNAAYLRELVAPAGAPDYWKDLASRYTKASRKLGGREKRIASERANACRQIERAVRKQLRSAPAN